MAKLFSIFSIFLFALANAQSEQLFLMKDGYIIDAFKTSEIDSLTFSTLGGDSLKVNINGKVFRIYSTVNDLDSIVFENPNAATKDIDGNVYHSVEINGKVWMTENLRTTHYNDGTPIMRSDSAQQWIEISQYQRKPTFSWYNDDSATYSVPYGAYYNGFAVETRKICPTGWHVATEQEWIDLRNFLGRNTLSQKLRVTGYDHWDSNPWSTPNNQYGFNAVGAGVRDASGQFENFHRRAYFFGYRQSSISLHLTILYHDDNDEAYSNIDQVEGASVRCVKN